jgi:ABC-type transporter Mla MlaB component
MSFPRRSGLLSDMGASAQETITFVIRGPIARDDLPGLWRRVRAVMSESGAPTLLCDVREVAPDAVTVDALCRLQLAARRHRCKVRLRHASQELLDLVAFMGLTEVLPD